MDVVAAKHLFFPWQAFHYITSKLVPHLLFLFIYCFCRDKMLKCEIFLATECGLTSTQHWMTIFVLLYPQLKLLLHLLPASSVQLSLSERISWVLCCWLPGFSDIKHRVSPHLQLYSPIKCVSWLDFSFQFLFLVCPWRCGWFLFNSCQTPVLSVLHSHFARNMVNNSGAEGGLIDPHWCETRIFTVNLEIIRYVGSDIK